MSSGAAAVVEELCLSSDEEVVVPVQPVAAAARTLQPGNNSNTSNNNNKRPHAQAVEEPLPYGWIKKVSKSKKGAIYYANIVTKRTQVERPRGHLPEQRGQVKQAPPVAKPPPVISAEELQRRKDQEEARRCKAEEAAAVREAELEGVKRQAAERRLAREKAIAEAVAQNAENEEENVDGPKEDSDTDASSEEISKEELARWKEEEERREKKEAERALKRRRSAEDQPEVLPAVPEVLEPCLDVLKDGQWLERHVLGGAKQRWVLGRSAAEADFPMNHGSISRQHAAVTLGGAGMFLTDLNSGHGVTVNGKKLEKNVPTLLKADSRITFGASTRQYVYHEPAKK